MTEKRSLVEIEEVSYQYETGRDRALSHFNLTITSGTCVGILGPNGAGKTTLLHMILGWLRPQSGKICFDGSPLLSYSRRELGKRIALVPQFENLAYDYSLLEYVCLGRAPYLPPLGMPGEEDYRIADQTLRLVGIAHLEQRSVLTLSGGEKQLVLLARALAQQPSLLLLDEPSTHLDLGNKIHLVEALRRLKAAGVTIILTTHEPDLAAAVADQLVLMRQGEVMFTGSLTDCLTTERMTNLYSQPVRVVEAAGKNWVVWS